MGDINPGAAWSGTGPGSTAAINATAAATGGSTVSVSSGGTLQVDQTNAQRMAADYPTPSAWANTPNANNPNAVYAALTGQSAPYVGANGNPIINGSFFGLTYKNQLDSNGNPLPVTTEQALALVNQLIPSKVESNNIPTKGNATPTLSDSKSISQQALDDQQQQSGLSTITTKPSFTPLLPTVNNKQESDILSSKYNINFTPAQANFINLGYSMSSQAANNFFAQQAADQKAQFAQQVTTDFINKLNTPQSSTLQLTAYAPTAFDTIGKDIQSLPGYNVIQSVISKTPILNYFSNLGAQYDQYLTNNAQQQRAADITNDYLNKGILNTTTGVFSGSQNQYNNLVASQNLASVSQSKLNTMEQPLPKSTAQQQLSDNYDKLFPTYQPTGIIAAIYGGATALNTGIMGVASSAATSVSNTNFPSFTKVGTNLVIGGAALIATIPGSIASLPYGLSWFEANPTQSPLKGITMASDTVQNLVTSEQKNPGFGIGQVLGIVVSGDVIEKSISTSLGYARTFNSKFVPIENIGNLPQEGYPLGKGQNINSIRESFSRGTTIPEPYKTSTNEPVRVVESARLPGETTVQEPYQAYTAHTGYTGGLNTFLSGKLTLGKGSSELPGAYAAPIVESYFLKVGGKIESTGISIFPEIKMPSIYRTPIKEIVEVPQSNGFDNVQTAKNIQANNAIGRAFAPLVKEEYEIVLPEGNVYGVSSTGYYTVVDGYRVPIYNLKASEIAQIPENENAFLSNKSGGYGDISGSLFKSNNTINIGTSIGSSLSESSFLYGNSLIERNITYTKNYPSYPDYSKGNFYETNYLSSIYSGSEVNFKNNENYTPTYQGNYTPTYQGNYTPTYQGNYTPTYQGNYTPTYQGNYTPTYQGNYTPTYQGNYTPTYQGNYTPTYQGNYTPTYKGNYTPSYLPINITTFIDKTEKTHQKAPNDLYVPLKYLFVEVAPVWTSKELIGLGQPAKPFYRTLGQGYVREVTPENKEALRRLEGVTPAPKDLNTQITGINTDFFFRTKTKGEGGPGIAKYQPNKFELDTSKIVGKYVPPTQRISQTTKSKSTKQNRAQKFAQDVFK